MSVSSGIDLMNPPKVTSASGAGKPERPLDRVATVNRHPDITGNEARVGISIAVRDGPRGAFASRETLASDSGLSLSAIKRALGGLTAKGLLTSKRRGPGRAARRILHYERFPAPSETDGPKAAAPLFDGPETGPSSAAPDGPVSGPIDGPVSGPIDGPETEPLNRKRTRRDEPEERARARATRLPDDWLLPNADAEWAARELGWPQERIAETEAIFRDHWLAEAGRNALRLDWSAVWRNWCRRERSLTGGGATSRTERNAEAARRFVNRNQARQDANAEAAAGAAEILFGGSDDSR